MEILHIIEFQAISSNFKQFQAISSNFKQFQAISSNFKQFQAIIALIVFLGLNTFDLKAQAPPTIVLADLGFGFVSATFTAPPNCSQTIINWGDNNGSGLTDCVNNSPTSPIIHQYAASGTYTVTITVYCGSTVLTASAMITVTIPTLVVSQSQTTETGDCGSIEVLTMQLSYDPMSGPLPGTLNLFGTIPGSFEHAGSDSFNAGSNNSVELSILGSSIPASPATITITLRLKPRFCVPATSVKMIINASAPIGLGLGVANCAALVDPPTNTTPNNAKFEWIVTPKSICVTVTKTTSPVPINSGGLAQFQITATNTGVVAANNVQLRDIIPAGLMLISSPANTTVNGNIATTPIGSIGIGASQVYNYVFRHKPVPCQVSAPYTNCVEVRIPSCNFISPQSCATVNVIAVLVPPNAAFTWQNVDCNTVQFTSTSNVSNQVHAWNFGNGLTSTLINPTIDFGNGTFSVTHTVTECGLTSTVVQSITINCDQCICSTLNSIHVDGGTAGIKVSEVPALNNLPTSGQNLVLDLDQKGRCLSIKGKLIIDKNILIFDPFDGIESTIFMSPGAEIEIQNLRKLTLNGVDIRACSTAMWRGINVLGGGNLSLIANRIFDAQFAVTAIPRSPFGTTRLDISRNKFINNHVGVRILPPTMQSNSLTQVSFESNEFYTLEMGLFPPFDVVPNYNGLSGYTGVIAQNPQFYIGYNNTFRRLRNGVIAENCKLDVYNGCKFENLIGTPNPTPTYANGSRGIGVLVNRGSAKVTGCSFNQLSRGVFATKNPVNVRFNNFTQVARGVEAHESSNIDISDNPRIQFSEYGITVRDIVFFENSKYTISNNNLDNIDIPATLSDRWAIEVDNTNELILHDNLQLPIDKIENNIFETNQQIGTIQVSNVGGWRIANNEGRYFELPILPGSAFSIDNSHNNNLVSNLFRTDPVTKTVGFRCNVSQGNIWCCNNTVSARTGFLFSGICTDTRFGYSTVEASNTALFCTDGTRLSVQKDRGNDFFPGSGTAFHASSNLLDVENSKFIVFDTNGDGLPNDDNESPDFIATPDWFEVDETDEGHCFGSESSCAYLDDPMKPGSTVTDNDLAVANIQFDLTDVRDQVRYWESARSLYARMQRYPALIGTHPATDVFLTAANSGKVGQYHQIEQSIRNLHLIPANLQADWQSNQAILAANDVQVAQQLNALVTASNSADSLLVYEQVAALRTLIDPALEVLLDITEQARLNRQVAASALLPQINALVASNVVEQNRKTVFQIYTNMVANGLQILSPTDFATITTIAEQCPLEGGSAVFLARGLYQYNDRRFFDDDASCNIKERGALLTKVVSEQLQAIPNPASNRIDILIPNSDQGGELRIIDIWGKTVCSNRIQFEQQRASIDVAMLPNGLYFCTFAPYNGKVTTTKIAIQH